MFNLMATVLNSFLKAHWFTIVAVELGERVPQVLRYCRGAVALVFAIYWASSENS